MLWQRTLTALVLIPIAVLAIAYLPNIYFGFATAFLLASVAWEWSKLAGIVGNKRRMIYTAVVLGAIDIASDIPPVLTLAIGAMAWFGALYCVCRYPNINKKIFSGWRACVISVLLLAPCWVGFNVLRAYGTKYIFAVLFMVWAADTGAYFAGRTFGRHKLAPCVSPKKTIEGLIGGMLLALIAYNGCFIFFASGWIGFLKWIVWEMLIISGLYLILVLAKSILLSFPRKKHLLQRSNYKKYLKLSFTELVFSIIIAIICSLTWKIGIRDWRLLMSVVLVVVLLVLFAVLGDLFISVVKRIANVKDSGTCLPGHGGILDRLDSVLSAVPIFALEMLLLTYLI